MKKFLLFIILLLSSSSIYSQYVTKKEGEVWGPEEQKYLQLGNQMERYISQNMYNSAMDCLTEMFSLKCKNANREKDLYALIHCSERLEKYDAVIRAVDLFEEVFPNSPILYKMIGQKAAAYAFGEKDYNKAIQNFEKALSLCPSNEYNMRSLYCQMIGESYCILKNYYLSKNFYKKSILYYMKHINTSISKIENYGIDSPELGQLFLDYRKPYHEDYNVFRYLGYLAAKCKHPQALSENSYLLQGTSINTIKSLIPKDLFSE